MQTPQWGSITFQKAPDPLALSLAPYWLSSLRSTNF